jgi:hypothetical protein
MKWRNINDEKPEDGQHILAEFKHGIIDCCWEEDEGVGYTYVWRDLSFYVQRWMPMSEFDNAIKRD